MDRLLRRQCTMDTLRRKCTIILRRKCTVLRRQCTVLRRKCTILLSKAPMHHGDVKAQMHHIQAPMHHGDVKAQMHHGDVVNTVLLALKVYD